AGEPAHAGIAPRAARQHTAPAERPRRSARVQLLVGGPPGRHFLPPIRNWTSASSCCFASDLNVLGMMFRWYPFSMYAFGSTIDVRTNATSGFPARRASAGSLSRWGPVVAVGPAGLRVWQPEHPLRLKAARPAPPLPGPWLAF